MMKRLLVSFSIPCLIALAWLVLGRMSAANDDATLSVAITVSPNTVILDSAGVWITVHADIDYAAVAASTLTLNDIPVAWTKSDCQGDLVGKFALDDVKSIIAPPSAELVLSGVRTDGVPFQGADVIQVSSGGRK